MVYAQLNRIQFGKGDVESTMSMAGTKAEPQAALIFQNREPTKISPIIDDEGKREKKTMKYDPQKDIVSKPESIDWMIAALQTIKDNTFGENNLVNKYLSKPIPM